MAHMFSVLFEAPLMPNRQKESLAVAALDRKLFSDGSPYITHYSSLHLLFYSFHIHPKA